MTFEGEFEKVHYPLPLNYLEEPDMQSMYKTFQRLQGQLTMGRSQIGPFGGGSVNGDARDTQSELAGGGGLQRYNTVQEFFKIEMENESLREQLYEVQSSFTAQDQ